MSDYRDEILLRLNDNAIYTRLVECCKEGFKSAALNS